MSDNRGALTWTLLLQECQYLSLLEGRMNALALFPRWSSVLLNLFLWQQFWPNTNKWLMQLQTHMHRAQVEETSLYSSSITRNTVEAAITNSQQSLNIWRSDILASPPVNRLYSIINTPASDKQNILLLSAQLRWTVSKPKALCSLSFQQCQHCLMPWKHFGDISKVISNT